MKQTKDKSPKNEVTHKVSLHIDEIPYVEMMRYAHEFSPNECSGVGLVERVMYDNGDVEFHVRKVFVPEQRNTPSTTDIDDDALNKLNTQLVVDGENTELLKFHWHSHVDMSTFHSVTDTENYDDMRTGQYGVSLVVNKRYETLASVHVYDPVRVNILDIQVNPPDGLDLDAYELPEDLRKKIDDNVQRVLKWQAEQRPKYFAPLTKGKKSYVVDDDYYDYGYGRNWGGYYDGLMYDPVLYSILIHAEREGLVKLLYDEYNASMIVGYVAVSNGTYYELSSQIDYSLATYGKEQRGGKK